MIHTIQQLMDKVSALHSLTVLCHREKYGKADGTYDFPKVNDLVAQIQAMAGDIYNDKQTHPKVLDKKP
tara:strand:- start:524 stop:730 length:207 start_codon:yes stop_codon:yes gene_type:complete